MIIECPSCRARYQYGVERFEGKPAKKIRCAKCQHVFEVLNPSANAPEPPRAFDADSTVARRVRPTPQPQQPVEGQTDRTPLPSQMPSGKRISLAVLTGSAAGTVHRIDKPQTTIGRSGADINIDDTEASRQHAMLEIREASYRIVDLDSTNGTLVDGAKITEAAELTDKAEFQIGGTILMLIVTDEQ